MGSRASKTPVEKANKKMEYLVGPGYQHMSEDDNNSHPQPTGRPRVTTQANFRQPSSDVYFSGAKSTATKRTPSSRPKQLSSSNKPSPKPESGKPKSSKPEPKNYNHPALKGKDNVKLVGSGADPSKNKAWMGDMKDVPTWGPGMLPAMSPESEVGKGQQRFQEGIARLREGKK